MPIVLPPEGDPSESGISIRLQFAFVGQVVKVAVFVPIGGPQSSSRRSACVDRKPAGGVQNARTRIERKWTRMLYSKFASIRVYSRLKNAAHRIR